MLAATDGETTVAILAALYFPPSIVASRSHHQAGAPSRSSAASGYRLLLFLLRQVTTPPDSDSLVAFEFASKWHLPPSGQPLMSRTLQTCFTCLSAIVLWGTVSHQPAKARILCQGEFQVTKNGLIATPYCGDEEIARVANSYGWNREAATVHTNPLSKVYICQTLGSDWRLLSPCAGYVPRGVGP